MFGFRKNKNVAKKQLTPNKFGEMLAAYILAFDVEQGQFRHMEHWQRYFTKISFDTFLKEWFIFRAFLMSIAFSNFFKEDKWGENAHMHFLNSFKKLSMEDNLYDSIDEIDLMLSSRYQAYSQEMIKNREPGYAYWVSKCFFLFCKIDPELKANLAQSVHFSVAFKSYVEAIEMLVDQFELIAE